ncbi:MAG: hypothetical protein QOE86_4058 [Solirubrobacteraceae bacterium]|jgi:uncharacterized membrane protein|nr:hypothetical protein [Solirubrobacteraceae bacterium]
MTSKAAITVQGTRDEVRRLWDAWDQRVGHAGDGHAAVSFKDAPGDRGTEIHVALDYDAPGGKLGGVVSRLTGRELVAKVKDDLRRFKQYVETGEVVRSDAVPEGELAERKFKQRPAHPLPQPTTDKVVA